MPLVIVIWILASLFLEHSVYHCTPTNCQLCDTEIVTVDLAFSILSIFSSNRSQSSTGALIFARMMSAQVTSDVQAVSYLLQYTYPLHRLDTDGETGHYHRRFQLQWPATADRRQWNELTTTCISTCNESKFSGFCFGFMFLPGSQLHKE